jgi:hypothetical protein
MYITYTVKSEGKREVEKPKPKRKDNTKKGL